MAQEEVQGYGYSAHYLPPSPPEHHSIPPMSDPYAHSSHTNATPRALEPYPTSPLQSPNRYSPYGRESPYGPPPPHSPYGAPQQYQTHPEYQHSSPQPQYQPLPSMSTFMSADGYVNSGDGPRNPDTTGQIQPPGMRPRLTTSLSEEEGSLCFQVDVNGICVARREDNHMINGTKLLNVVGMTRGRRDGILKAEKQKQVVKIGPMHLKGVWIPYERALALANQEKITEKLYPLFFHNIGSLLYHPTNVARTLPMQSQYPQQPLLHEQGVRAEEEDDRGSRL
ncbi:Cell pattern formation-associated STUA [Hyphodiscus hymeniophilus]|uniref:Cell pattern formation-associated STUA n=1 Tax=Hyphodiscus hymeniophilus TaxID=353542 RepID=A0A9P6VGC4_9HELO|nr:Cell pattern formation-associated STUA [Hyphodiscus hymeniophilus]